MATNTVGPGLRVHVTAGANRSSGDFVYEGGFHGRHVNDVLSGDLAVLDITQQEIEVPAVGGVARGDRLYMTTTNTLTETAGTNRLVGICTAVAGEMGTPTGFMRLLVLPQNATVPA